MAQPRDYTRQYNFNDYQATSPSDPLRGSEIDGELNAVKLTLDDLNANIAKIQRDDGKLGNTTVHKDAFDQGALAIINSTFTPRGNWSTATSYVVNDAVDFNGATYVATIAHTSSAAFATDDGLDRWILIANAAISGTGSAVDKFEGDGSTTAFTLSYNYTTETAVQVFVNGELLNPVDNYTLSGTTLTLFTAPGLPVVAGNENVIVWGTSVVAQAAAADASGHESNASGYADESQSWASKTNGLVESTDYSSKAWSIGGTGVDTGSGSAKDWASKVSGTVGNTTEYSSKYWATQGDVPIVAAGIANITTVAGQISPTNNVATLAGISAAVTNLSGISSDVTTVSGISADVSAVAADGTDIGTVAGISANVTTVAGANANITTVAGANSNITTIASDLTSGSFVAGSEYDFGSISTPTTGTSGSPDGFIVTVYNNLGDITSLAGQVSNISTLGSISSNITTVAGISGNVTTVAGISSNVTSVAGVSSSIPTVAGISSDVSTVAGISSAVSTVASNVSGINDFADRYRVGSSEPSTSLDVGDLFYNTSSTTLKIYNGSAWEAGVTAGSGLLAQSSNLSDLQSAASARTNLGLGTAATSNTGDFAAAVHNHDADYAALSHTHTLANITDSGTMASQNANNVNITGGVIDGGSIV